MDGAQLNSVDDVADFVASFLLRNSCSEQEVGVAKDSIIREKIDGEALFQMTAEELQKVMCLRFGDAKKLEKAEREVSGF